MPSGALRASARPPASRSLVLEAPASQAGGLWATPRSARPRQRRPVSGGSRLGVVPAEPRREAFPGGLPSAGRSEGSLGPSGTVSERGRAVDGEGPTRGHFGAGIWGRARSKEAHGGRGTRQPRTSRRCPCFWQSWSDSGRRAACLPVTPSFLPCLSLSQERWMPGAQQEPFRLGNCQTWRLRRERSKQQAG